MDAFLTRRWDPTVMLAALRCALAPWLQVHGEWLINLSRRFGSTCSYFNRLPLFIVELARTDVSDFACFPHHYHMMSSKLRTTHTCSTFVAHLRETSRNTVMLGMLRSLHVVPVPGAQHLL